MAAIFWGANYAATKYAAAEIPPLLIVALRFTGASLLLFCALRILEPKSRLARADIPTMAALGCFGIGTAQTCFTFGVSMTSTANTGLIFATAPVWGLLLGFVLGLERPSRTGVLGILLSIVGIGIVFHEGLGAADSSTIGNCLILLAAMGVGSYTVFSMPVLQRYSPLAVATYPTLFAAPAVLLISSPLLPGLDWGGVGAGSWAAVGYSAAFATAFAFSAWQRGISRIGANRVLIYQYLITLTGIVSGIIFFGEHLTSTKVLGGAIVLVGVYFARRR